MSLEVKEPLPIDIIGYGLVGKKFAEILHERGHNLDNTRVLASERSAGQIARLPSIPDRMGGRSTTIELASEASYAGRIVFNAATAEFSLEHGERIAQEADAYIDSSSGWRNNKDVPIVIPEINPQAAQEAKLGIIAKPNCTTALGALALHYLDKEAGLKSLDVDTYQSDSGQGQPGLNEHDRLVRVMIARGDELVHGQKEPYPNHRIYPVIPVFNSSPVAGVFEDGSDHTTEELKYKNETRKIFGRTEQDLPIDVTCARTGGYNCHALSIHAEFEDSITADQAEKILYESEGINLHGNRDIPQPIYVAGTDPVHVGRVRQSERFGKHGLKFWVVADNLRKGAALNAVQIVEMLVDKRS